MSPWSVRRGSVYVCIFVYVSILSICIRGLYEHAIDGERVDGGRGFLVVSCGYTLSLDLGRARAGSSGDKGTSGNDVKLVIILHHSLCSLTHPFGRLFFESFVD